VRREARLHRWGRVPGIGRGVAALAFLAVIAPAYSALAQPVAGTRGCCCVVQGVAYRCSEKTEADCLALQPAAPRFSKVEDWKKAWDAFVAASKAQEAKPMHGGWIAESCADAINPATGEPRGAPTGCCCFPKLHPTESDRYDCKPSLTDFDCKVECSMLKDGRLPSGCTWTAGACRP